MRQKVIIFVLHRKFRGTVYEPILYFYENESQWNTQVIDLLKIFFKGPLHTVRMPYILKIRWRCIRVIQKSNWLPTQYIPIHSSWHGILLAVKTSVLSLSPHSCTQLESTVHTVCKLLHAMHTKMCVWYSSHMHGELLLSALDVDGGLAHPIQ